VELSTKKSVNLIKNTIINLVKEMLKDLEKNQFLMNSNEVYIIKPIHLLKLWNNLSEDKDISSYVELTQIFLIKTLIKTNDIERAYHEVTCAVGIDIDNTGNTKSQLFYYYFGKVIVMIIENINQIKDDEILKFMKGVDSYIFIKKILITYGKSHSLNYRKLGKTFQNLAIISDYFKVGAKS
jgi:hypothetical protein